MPADDAPPALPETLPVKGNHEQERMMTMSSLQTALDGLTIRPNVGPAVAAEKPITTRNRVSVSVGSYNWANPSEKSGMVEFWLADDAPGRRASFICSTEIALDIKGETDPYEMAVTMRDAVGEKHFRGFSREPSLADVIAYLEQEHVAERDYYLLAVAELPKIEEQIERLERRYDTYQKAKTRYEAGKALDSMMLVGLDGASLVAAEGQVPHAR